MQDSTAPPRFEHIPSEIAEAYALDSPRLARLGGGLVNLTYEAEASGSKLALQRLAAGTPEAAIDDFVVYTGHLHNDGWYAPEIKPTVTGDNYTHDQSGRLWRGMDYIACDAAIPADTSSSRFLEGAGALLAKWHRSISWLDHQPQYQVPHLHDTLHHIEKLQELQELLPNRACQSLARSAIQAYTLLEPLPKAPSQLIHGDPKLTNMLFRDGKPFTLIDFDTVMHGPVWYDIGDLLRSVVKDNLHADISATDIVEAISTSYFDGARPGISVPEFMDRATLATQHITVELLARYLNDIVEESYFTWDDTQFASRADNHLSRASDQWQVFERIQNKE